MATNSTYTLTQSQSNGPVYRANGRVVYDATAITATDSSVFTVGFTPKYVMFQNLTDRVKIEWWEGMAANSCIKTAAAGTVTLEVTGGNGGITVGTRAAGTEGTFAVLQNATLAAILASKTCTWVAEG